MPKVLIVYCSITGNTKAAAEAIAEGARTAGAQVTIKEGTAAQPSDLLECDAVALGSYDAFSLMGGGLKDFLDRSYYPTQGQVTDKPYAPLLPRWGGKSDHEALYHRPVLQVQEGGESVLVKGKPEVRLDHLKASAQIAEAAGK